MRRLKLGPLMWPRCRALTTIAVRPRHDAGKPSSWMLLRRMRMKRTFTRP